MPRTEDMIPSKSLKQRDIGIGQLWTVNNLEFVKFKGTDKEDEKWVIHFTENPKGLPLNKTNIKLLEKICGSDNTDDWIGKKVVLYWDDTVDYMGEIVGGIRFRAPKTQAEIDLPF
jgi:hypothetical protein